MISGVGTGHVSVTIVAWERLIFYLAQSAFARAMNKTSQRQHPFSTGCARRSLIPQRLCFLGLRSRTQLNGLAGAQFETASSMLFGASWMMSAVATGHAFVDTAVLQRLIFSLAQSVFARATSRMLPLQHPFSMGFARSSLELQIFRKYQLPPRPHSLVQLPRQLHQHVIIHKFNVLI
jgi:hypothetical protein